MNNLLAVFSLNVFGWEYVKYKYLVKSFLSNRMIIIEIVFIKYLLHWRPAYTCLCMLVFLSEGLSWQLLWVLKYKNEILCPLIFYRLWCLLNNKISEFFLWRYQWAHRMNLSPFCIYKRVQKSCANKKTAYIR